jgi:hypothetical protein
MRRAYGAVMAGSEVVVINEDVAIRNRRLQRRGVVTVAHLVSLVDSR